MRCPSESKENSEVLLDYCSQKISPESKMLLEEHLAGCPRCAAFVKAQDSLWNTMDLWSDVPVSSGFNRNLYARIDELESSSWWTRVHQGALGQSILGTLRWRPVVPVFTACLTLAAALFLYSPGSHPVPGQGTSAPALKDSVDLEQVQATLDDMEMLKQLSSPSPSGRSAKI